MMLASLTKQSVLALDPQEAKALGVAITNVARHYDGGVMSQKTLDWINLAQTLGMVYGTRLFVMRAATAQKKAASAPAPDAASPTGGDPFAGQPAMVQL